MLGNAMGPVGLLPLGAIIAVAVIREVGCVFLPLGCVRDRALAGAVLGLVLYIVWVRLLGAVGLLTPMAFLTAGLATWAGLWAAGRSIHHRPKFSLWEQRAVLFCPETVVALGV